MSLNKLRNLTQAVCHLQLCCAEILYIYICTHKIYQIWEVLLYIPTSETCARLFIQFEKVHLIRYKHFKNSCFKKPEIDCHSQIKNSSLDCCLKTKDYVLSPVYVSLYVKFKERPIGFAEKNPECLPRVFRQINSAFQFKRH